MEDALRRIDLLYRGDGWYADGADGTRDYYVAFAFHYYGLLYSRLARAWDAARAERFRERAVLFARHFVHWFAADGAGIPFGRSLVYRFAQASFWSALAFADVPALPWGVVKGLALRNLRWWLRRPILDSAGVLTLGFAYPNLNVIESYNAPASPYWAFKHFLCLAAPDDHPFWMAEEAPLPHLAPAIVQEQPALIVCGDTRRSHVFALAGGQENPSIRHGEAKYAKFAYSTAFAFSVPSSAAGLAQGAYDSMLALSEDGRHYRVREGVVESAMLDGVLFSRWRPWPDVEVRTWLIALPPWHVRVHVLGSRRRLVSAEGGYALDRTENPAGAGPRITDGRGLSLAVSGAGWSGIRDLSSGRVGRVQTADPNTNLLHPRTLIPTLLGEHHASERLACAVLGMPPGEDGSAAWGAPPTLVELAGGRQASVTLGMMQVRLDLDVG